MTEQARKLTDVMSEIKDAGIPGRKFAEMIGVKYAQMYDWMAGDKPVPPMRAVLIEEKANEAGIEGVVAFEDLNPEFAQLVDRAIALRERRKCQP